MGQKFGRLTVVADGGRTAAKQIRWHCRCDCGGEAFTTSTKLKNGHTRSCGCWKKERTSEVARTWSQPAYHPDRGQEFGRWTVLGDGPRSGATATSLCRCVCGAERYVQVRLLLNGESSSCGCGRADAFVERNTKHGYYSHPLFRTWMAMIYRCHKRTCPSYSDYGGRGIFVCDRWRFGEGGLSGFECFIDDVPNRPSPLHSIDRIDNDSGYYPDNVRWATAKQQMNNRRNSKANREVSAP